MIQITKKLKLQPILASDSETSYKLMSEIYPPAYAHFWTDQGNWYVNTQYARAHILSELENKKAEYYFIVFNDQVIGNFRFVWDEKLEGVSEGKQVKLHRLYLHPKSQGNGIGKKVFSWLKEKAIQNEYQLIWLDAMNAKPQAFEFYKNLGFRYFSHVFLDFTLMLDEVRKMSQLYLKISY